MNVQIVIFDGFDELDAIAPHEVWRMAKELKPEVEVQLVTLEGAKEITAANGLRVRAEGKLGAKRPNLIVVPGGGWIGRSPAEIAKFHGDGVVMASVCTGAMLLATAGLLKNRPATTHHGALEELAAMGAQVIRARVVDDGDIITAGGITSGLDLSLWLVERFLGPQTAHKLEESLEYERRGTVWKKAN